MMKLLNQDIVLLNQVATIDDYENLLLQRENDYNRDIYLKNKLQNSDFNTFIAEAMAAEIDREILNELVNSFVDFE